MENIPKLISLILAISAMRIVSGQLLLPGQQIGNSSNCVADTFGNIGTCQRISECRGERNSNELNLCRNDNAETKSEIDPIVCCPPSSSRPPLAPGTIGGQNGGNEQNGGNGQNEQNGNIQRPPISQKVGEQFSNPDQQFGTNFHGLADNFGNTGTCQKISECQQFGPIICCPPTRSRPPQKPSTIGGQIVQNENIQKQSVSQRKCLQNYPPLPIVQKEDSIFNITGGEPFPYMAVIGWENEDGGYDFKCGGFLVEKKFVVTAGLCRNAPGKGPPSVVRLGSKSLDTSEAVNIKIARIILHPKYKSMLTYNDIAVFQLESEVPNRPVCLWSNDEINFQEATAIGYGTTEYKGQASSKLKKVKLSIFSNEECSQLYPHVRQIPNGIDQSQLCAGDRNGVKDTCQGDTGGPLLVTSLEHLQIIPYVIGITSFGPTNCNGKIPAGFTRISSFLPWIESVVWPNEF